MADKSQNPERSSSPPASETAVKAYREIMAIVQRYEMPSNIREINDLPLNPVQAVSNSLLAPRLKLWFLKPLEVAQSQSSTAPTLQAQENYDGNGHNNHLNGNSSTPWWQQQKIIRISEIELKNKTGYYSGETYNERPVQQSWIPQQPPPVVMAEAAATAAIRQLKKSPLQKEHLSDDQFLMQSSELSDELQRITKISESGGSSIMKTSENQTTLTARLE